MNCQIDKFKIQKVEVKKTDKFFIITFLEDCITSFYKKGDVLRCRFDNQCHHNLRDWKDGTYTVYPNRSGVPYYLYN